MIPDNDDYIGMPILNSEGVIKAHYGVRTVPVYVGTDKEGDPFYKMCNVVHPIIHRFPEMVVDFSDN